MKWNFTKIIGIKSLFLKIGPKYVYKIFWTEIFVGNITSTETFFPIIWTAKKCYQTIWDQTFFNHLICFYKIIWDHKFVYKYLQTKKGTEQFLWTNLGKKHFYKKIVTKYFDKNVCNGKSLTKNLGMTNFEEVF